MTQNRKRKHAIRAVKDAAGTSYTTAMRAQWDVRDPFTVRLGRTAPGEPLTVPLGTADRPVAWFGGRIGSGITGATATVVAAFLSGPGPRRVVWLDPHAGQGQPYREALLALNAARKVEFWPTQDDTTVHRLTALADQSGPAAPVLVVISDVLDLITPGPHRSAALLTALGALAGRSPSPHLRILVTGSTTPVAGPTLMPGGGVLNLAQSRDPNLLHLRDAYGPQGPNPDDCEAQTAAAGLIVTLGARSRDCAVWVSLSTPETWTATFPGTTMPPEAAGTPIGYGWVRLHQGAPVPVRFRTPSVQAARV